MLLLQLRPTMKIWVARVRGEDAEIGIVVMREKGAVAEMIEPDNQLMMTSEHAKVVAKIVIESRTMNAAEKRTKISLNENASVKSAARKDASDDNVKARQEIAIVALQRRRIEGDRLMLHLKLIVMLLDHEMSVDDRVICQRLIG